ncbi:hypothetical protein V0288_14810 [Pannus brasiliensis CCIBt3594]|uniref:Uncharacterized protein n=1 Tax=Pannus brasiliensis CCIBt3594 TaxID=1427578 RepID=A0AAW9QYZ1_9CHRO
MTGRLSKLEQDLTTIGTEVAELAVKMQERYRNYLDILGESVYKQAIVAVYHLCTRSYPGEFLALSHTNRQKLQEDIKALGQETRLSLKELGEINLDRTTFAALEAPAGETGTIEQKKLLKALLEKGGSEPVTEPIDNPDALAHWCRAIEKSSVNILDHLSKKINHQLQQAYILPARLPGQILDMAIQAENEGQSLGGGHNLLSVMIEAENRDSDDEEDEDEEQEREELILPQKITKLTAIHLRLSEIEFADTRLSIERNQLRALWEQLEKIRERYRRTHREYTIARAEAAWRSSWYD